MKIQITLENNSAYSNVSEMLPCDHTLQLLGNYNLKDTIISIKNMDTIEQVKYNGEEVEIPESVLKAGELYITIRAYIHGILYKTWVVEPILIRYVNAEFYAFSEFRELKEKCSELEQRVKALEESMDTTNNYLKDIWNNLEV